MAVPASSMQGVNSYSIAIITTQVSDLQLIQTQSKAPQKEQPLGPTELPVLSKRTDNSITYCPNLAYLTDISKIWKNIREYLLQVGGTSMGTGFTPSYANTCMTGFEKSAQNK